MYRLSSAIPVAILVALLWAPVFGCKRKASPKTGSSGSNPGILMDGVGVVRAGQSLDISKLQTEGADRYRRWARQDKGDRVRFTRAYPISGSFGNRIRPTHIYLREEIWTHRGRVVHVGQGYTAVKKQCTTGMRAAHRRLSALVKACMVKGSFVLRQEGRLAGLVHYLCELGPVALMIDILPRVPEFVGERETRGGRFTVGQFWKSDIKDWLRKRFSQGAPSNAAAFFAELAPLTRHLKKCKSAGN